MRLTYCSSEGEDGDQGDVRPHVAAEISGNQLEVEQSGIHCIYTAVNCVCSALADASPGIGAPIGGWDRTVILDSPDSVSWALLKIGTSTYLGRQISAGDREK